MKEEKSVSIKVDEGLIDLIDKVRSSTKTTRTAWIIQAMRERLERLGYELDN